MTPNAIYLVDEQIEAGTRGRLAIHRAVRIARDASWNLVANEGWLARVGRQLWFTFDTPQVNSPLAVHPSQAVSVDLRRQRLVIGDTLDRYIIEIIRDGAKWVARHGRQHMLKNARVNLAPLWRD